MGYIEPQRLQQIKEVDLLSFMKVYEPQELKKISGNNYCTVTHDSLLISNGLWNWFSQGIGGKTALDYLIKVKGLSFTVAAETIESIMNVAPLFGSEQATQPLHKKDAPKEKKRFELPMPAINNRNVFRYLTMRGIDREIVNYCFQKKVIYQCKKYGNAVFVGHDEKGIPKYATRRATNSNFKADVLGSDKRFCFHFENPAQPMLCVFESAIDLLSFATLIKQCLGNWQDFTLLSVGGVNKIGEIPIALNYFLERNPYITNIMLCFDNDEVGKKAAENIHQKLKSNYTISILNLAKGKDINEFLMIQNSCKTMQKER